MSHLERLLGQAKESLWDPEYAERARDLVNGIRADTYDKIQWEYALDRLPILRKQVDTLGGDFETSPPAYEDLFNLLMQGDPRPTDDEVVDKKYLPQAHMMRAMGDGVEFDVLRRKTKYDEYYTSLAMLTMRDKMRRAFEELQELMDAIQAAQEALARAYQEALEAAASGEGEGDAAQALADALQAAQEASGESSDLADSLMRQATKDAQDKIDQDQELSAAYGLDPGKVRRMSFEERRKLTEQLSPAKLAEVADLVGQFRRSADQERRRAIVHSIDEVVDYKLGNDLNRLAESELVNLATPELEDLFDLRLVRHELLVRETRTLEHADRGPIVFVCDESGSMDIPLNDHTREAWSKAVALAMRDHAARQKRDFIYIGYGGTGQVWEKVFPKGAGPVEDVVDFVSHFYGGGTEYQRPLRQAMDRVTEYHGRGQGRPDIVFVTDGDFRVPEKFKTFWQEAREEAGVKCYGIQVGGTPTSDMRKIVDRCLQVDRLTADPSGVRELFRTI